MASTPRNLAPIWITLGFAAGAVFSWLVSGESPSKVRETPPSELKSEPAPPATISLVALEQNFRRWGGYAVWEDDWTEFAAREARPDRPLLFVQVRRANGNFYFRTIPKLTRPVIDHGPRTNLPFAFTEPAWMREAFYRDNPDYDRNQEPFVELPPRAPERFALPPPRPPAAQPRAIQLTPGG